MRVKDNLLGRVFGELTVIEDLGKIDGRYSWKCQCSCGNTKISNSPYLKSGDTSTCGDRIHKLGPRVNLTGNKYGKLEVLSFSHTTPSNSMSNYLCKCACGNEKVITHGSLQSGSALSCGCEQYKTGEASHGFKHGKKHTKAYKSWCKIKARCYNDKSQDYPMYGAKGIIMDEDFRSDFIAFYTEIGDSPENNHTWSVDRIDHTKGYVQGNIRWATPTQQSRNKGMFVVNTSGVTGVQFYDHQGRNGTSWLYVVATWYSLGTNGKAQNKKFSVKKHGLLPAFKMACEYRIKMIEELNQQGAGYTENHGK